VTQATGELYDLGYQHYDGPREGQMRARKAVFVDGFRTTLGIGHGPLAKVLPILLFGAAMAPAVIMAIIVSLTQGALDLPGHADYYEVVSVILVIFSAIIAPELLCPDRRNGVISLYLVRPLTITDYVVGRWLAFFTIALALVYSGQIVLLAGLILSASDPLEYFKDNWLDIPRILAAGLLVAIFITTLPLAVSAFTDRRAYAAAIVIGLFIISTAAAGILTECHESHDGSQQSEEDGRQCEPITGDAAKWLGLVGISRVPTNVNNMIFRAEDEGRRSQLTAELPRIVPIG
jgi:ABC-2 type transport system permease protein